MDLKNLGWLDYEFYKQKKSEKMEIEASLTAEAALVMPIVIGVVFAVLSLTLFLYETTVEKMHTNSAVWIADEAGISANTIRISNILWESGEDIWNLLEE